MKSFTLSSPGVVIITVIINFISLLSPSFASVWDPHLWPQNDGNKQPYFEGWYTRATLSNGSSDSIAILFGASNLPENGTAPPNYIAILHGDSRTNKTKVYEGVPKSSSITITHHGQQVTKQPEWNTQPDFEWRSDEMSALMDGSHLYIEAELEEARLWLEVEVKEWTYDGAVKPHSWTDVIQGVPLHWYVHTLSSQVIHCGLELPASSTVTGGNSTTRVIEAKGGLAHLEKNWGTAFPKAWLWAQGVKDLRMDKEEEGELKGGGRYDVKREEEDDRSRSVALAICYGEITKGIYTHFIHYRDEAANIAWDFKPDNSILPVHKVQACGRHPTHRPHHHHHHHHYHQEGEGREGIERGAIGVGHQQGGEGENLGDWEGRGAQARFVVFGFEDDGFEGKRKRRRLAIDMYRPTHTATCLRGPTGQGFEKLCEESFQGQVRLTATLDGRLVGEHMIDRLAFELGAGFLCETDNACRNSSSTFGGEGKVSITGASFRGRSPLVRDG